MLVIRTEQMGMFRQARTAQLPGKIKNYLKERCSEKAATMQDSDFDALIQCGLSAATSCQLEIEWDLCRFCWLELLHGPSFHETQEWAQCILAQPHVSPHEKIDSLEQYHLNYLDTANKPQPAESLRDELF